jgi:hypothetical protein
MQRLFGGVPATLTFLSAQSAALSLPLFNPATAAPTLDPVMLLGMVALGGSLASFLFGGFAFRQIHAWKWPLWHHKFREMEGEFARRVRRFRANVPPTPTQLTGTDFYGEKVASLRGYRRWLRQQINLRSARQFNL